MLWIHPAIKPDQVPLTPPFILLMCYILLNKYFRRYVGILIFLSFEGCEWGRGGIDPFNYPNSSTYSTRFRQKNLRPNSTFNIESFSSTRAGVARALPKYRSSFLGGKMENKVNSVLVLSMGKPKGQNRTVSKAWENYLKTWDNGINRILQGGKTTPMLKYQLSFDPSNQFPFNPRALKYCTLADTLNFINVLKICPLLLHTLSGCLALEFFIHKFVL